VVVCFNRYSFDTDEEMALVREHCKEMGVAFAENNAFTEGGKGAEELARVVVKEIEEHPSGPLRFAYDDEDSIQTKVEKIAKNIYGASRVRFAPLALKNLRLYEKFGYSHLPVCIAKTQYSFSDEATKYGVPENFDFTIRDFVISAGAEMVVAIAGNIMRMPGLPKEPQALHIDVVDGEIVGLS
jgi:formate--tetrahydrofolate ligase